MSLREITRSAGRPYLRRYGWGDQTLAQAKADRRSGAWRARLHHFVGPDDAGHHNHPFRWALSLVLRGAYIEEVLDTHTGIVTTHTRRWFNWIPAGKYHRIVSLRGDVWTLFITGPRVQSWGFWSEGKHVPWREYNARLGKDSDT